MDMKTMGDTPLLFFLMHTIQGFTHYLYMVSVLPNYSLTVQPSPLPNISV